MAGNSLTFLLLIAGICIVIGSVFGWLMASLRGSPEPEKPAYSTPPLPPQPVVGQHSLLRLMRDPETGSLNLELDTKLVQTVDQLSVEERKRVVDLLKETTVWLGLIPPPARAAQTPASAPAPLAQIQPAVPAAVSTGPVKPSVIGGVTHAIANVLGPAPVIEEEPKSMVRQIDEILQAQLIGTPSGSQKIYLTEDPRRGVLVCVGSATYEGIGAVPEGDVKKLLKSSVQEWERQQEELRRRRKTN